MQRGTLKHIRDMAAEDHGGTLHWPGTEDGFPVRGDRVPDLKQEEFEQIQRVLDFKSGRFRMWEPSEKAQFDVIMDRIVNGLYMQHKRFDNWVEEHQDYVVRLEWAQIYGEVVEGKSIVPADTDTAHVYQIRPGTQAAGNLGPQPLSLPSLRRG